MFIYITHSDNQSFLANTNCPVLLLLSHLRSKVGVPPSEAIDVCDKLGNPKMLFQVKTMQDRASDFLLARSTYYVCRVEFGAPGTCRVPRSPWSFVPLLKNPSVALTGGCGMGMRGVGVPARGCCRAPSPISVGRSTSRPREEQHGPPRKTPLPPRGRQQPRPR
uniref:Chromosome X open reading frame 65 n=1 Tax=Gallus gallus TaxID=9031 RepID=A0A8V0Z7B2_CHICK